MHGPLSLSYATTTIITFNNHTNKKQESPYFTRLVAITVARLGFLSLCTAHCPQREEGISMWLFKNTCHDVRTKPTEAQREYLGFVAVWSFKAQFGLIA